MDKAEKDDNIVITNAYDNSRIPTQDEIFAAGEAFELEYFHDYETVGASDPRSIEGVELYSWIYDNAFIYGFVVADKDSPNVFRYVGTVHAKIMHEKNLEFDEYLEMLKNDTSPATPIGIKDGAKTYAVYFLKMDEKHIVPKNYDYEISGNNVDGYIITVDLTK